VGKLITLNDAAKRLVILKHVLRRLISSGNLKAYRINAGSSASTAPTSRRSWSPSGPIRAVRGAVRQPSTVRWPLPRFTAGRTPAPWPVIARFWRGRWDSPFGQGNRM
jgi:hypothetical protein